MAQWKLGLGILALMVGCLTGCKPPVEANLSPDGKTVAFTNDDGLNLRDVSGRSPDKVIRLENAGSPLFSPDSSQIAIRVGPKACLLDLTTWRWRALPPISPPFAWNRSGTELIGLKGQTASVVYVKTGTVVRNYPLPITPLFAISVGDDRDLAFADGSSIVTVHRGVVRSRKVQGRVCMLGLDKTSQSPIWGEGDMGPLQRSPGPSHAIPHDSVIVRTCSIDLASEAMTIATVDVSAALGAPGRFAEPSSIAVSPDGSRLALVGFVDASDPGLMERFAALGGFDHHKQGSSTEAKLNALSKKMRFRTVCSVLPVSGSRMAPRIVKSKEQFFVLRSSICWSADGNTLGTVFDDDVATSTVP